MSGRFFVNEDVSCLRGFANLKIPKIQKKIG